jgi:hypothetical protein
VLYAWVLILGMVGGGAALGALFTWSRADTIIAEQRADYQESLYLIGAKLNSAAAANQKTAGALEETAGAVQEVVKTANGAAKTAGSAASAARGAASTAKAAASTAKSAADDLSEALAPQAPAPPAPVRQEWIEGS